MAQFKCTVGFEVAGKGWSETYYDIATDHEAAKANFDLLLPKRVAMNTPDVKTTFLRIANEDHARDSLVYLPIPAIEQGTYAAAGDAPTCNLAQDAVLLDMVVNPGFHNRRFLRGVSDSVFTGGHGLLTPGFLAAYTLWANHMVANGWCGRRVRTVGNQVTKEYTSLTSIQVKGVTTRKVGRPFGQRPGRRKTTARGAIRAVRRAITSGLVTAPQVIFAANNPNG